MITAKRRLTWFDGKRRVARGRSATLIGLSAGTHKLTLEARGVNGQRGRTTVPVTVLGVKPDLIITAPALLKKTARSVSLKVSSTVPAQLRVGDRTFSVDRKARSISIRIKPGKSTLSLKLAVRGGGGQATYAVRLKRK